MSVSVLGGPTHRLGDDDTVKGSRTHPGGSSINNTSQRHSTFVNTSVISGYLRRAPCLGYDKLLLPFCFVEYQCSACEERVVLKGDTPYGNQESGERRAEGR